MQNDMMLSLAQQCVETVPQRATCNGLGAHGLGVELVLIGVPDIPEAASKASQHACYACYACLGP